MTFSIASGNETFEDRAPDEVSVVIPMGGGIDRAELLASVLAGDEFARGMATMVVPVDAYRPGALDDPVFRQLYVAVRLWEIPRLVKAALGGHESAMVYLHDVYRNLDPTLEAPWDLIPNPVADRFTDVPPPNGVNIEALRRGLQRIWAEATERAITGA
jgi:hypothetical protein